MTQTLEEIEQIARDLVREQSLPVEVVGISHSNGEGSYTELVLNIRNCHVDPCQVELGVFRDMSPAAVRAEIADKLRFHLEQHRL